MASTIYGCTAILLIEFEKDDDGQYTALIFKSGYKSELGRQPRVADLPDALQ